MTQQAARCDNWRWWDRWDWSNGLDCFSERDGEVDALNGFCPAVNDDGYHFSCNDRVRKALPRLDSWGGGRGVVGGGR